MSRFLSDEWIAAVAAAVGGEELEGVAFTLQQNVKGTPDGDVSYTTTFADGNATASRGASDTADVALSMDHATATELARGELIPQAAFMQGKLKVTGNMGSLLQNQQAIAALARAMGMVETEF